MNTNRKLTVGTYKPSASFRKASEHIAVCFEDDSNLVAITGYADDTPENIAESIAYATIFAHAPETLKALEQAAFALETIANMQGNREVMAYAIAARNAIKEARTVPR